MCGCHSPPTTMWTRNWTSDLVLCPCPQRMTPSRSSRAWCCAMVVPACTRRKSTSSTRCWPPIGRSPCGFTCRVCQSHRRTWTKTSLPSSWGSGHQPHLVPLHTHTLTPNSVALRVRYSPHVRPSNESTPSLSGASTGTTACGMTWPACCRRDQGQPTPAFSFTYSQRA